MARKQKEKQPITQDVIVGRLMEVYERCMQEEPTKDGGSKIDARGALQALEMVSRLLGFTVTAKNAEGGEIVLRLAEEAESLGE